MILNNDLIFNNEFGYACQADRTIIKKYDSYYDYCISKYNNKAMSEKVNNARKNFITENLLNKDMSILDIGIGNGSFIKSRPNTSGFDIDKKAVEWLKENNKYNDEFEKFTAFTMWDVLEHLPSPGDYLKRMSGFLFLSLPIFNNLTDIRLSKHYIPGEHLWYFTSLGLRKYLKQYGFNYIKEDDFEIKCGREQIYSYIFIK